jgi:hypothetical protein
MPTAAGGPDHVLVYFYIRLMLEAVIRSGPAHLKQGMLT